MHSSNRVLLVALLLIAAACHPEFQVTSYTTNEALYKAATAEYRAGHWDNAVTAFEKLTTDLSARDTLLPRAHWYLARAHAERGEWVLAASSYSRLTESFPDDSLADHAALEAARAYARMWRKPALDPTYGESARAGYTTMLALYPSSPLVPAARQELAQLENMFAEKDYLSGMYYFRRGGYDSGIIYFKDVVAKWPTSPSARLAQLRLVEAFKAIRYKDDAQDTCAALRSHFPGDADVGAVCAGVAAPALPATTNATPARVTAPPATTGPPAPAIPPALPSAS
jgi:outer membrane protein assembly factor BamD